MKLNMPWLTASLGAMLFWGAPSHAQRNEAMDPTTRAFLQSLAKSGSPDIASMTPAQVREALNESQDSDLRKLPPTDSEEMTFETPAGNVRVTLVRPAGVRRKLPVIVFFHGGGWIAGNYAPTHERLVRRLSVGAQAAVVVVDYALSPDARYPIAVEQCFAVTEWIAAHGDELNVDGDRLAVAGNSVGGTMAAVVSLKASAAGKPKIRLQALLSPVTDAGFRTDSYRRYAEGYFLTAKAMRYLWDQYTPDLQRRLEPMASPLRATSAQLQGLPPALVQTAEFDILRDEGEQYAHRLIDAGVPVTMTRYGGTVHDFALINALKDTPAARGALRQLIAEMKAHLY